MASAVANFPVDWSSSSYSALPSPGKPIPCIIFFSKCPQWFPLSCFDPEYHGGLQGHGERDLTDLSGVLQATLANGFGHAFHTDFSLFLECVSLSPTTGPLHMLLLFLEIVEELCPSLPVNAAQLLALITNVTLPGWTSLIPHEVRLCYASSQTQNS